MFFRATWYVKRHKVKLESLIEEKEGLDYHFTVGEHKVKLLVKKEEGPKNRPYRKDWSCSCTHSSLIGQEKNIICSEILACIGFIFIKTLIGEKV